jgi:hypothetical protein
MANYLIIFSLLIIIVIYLFISNFAIFPLSSGCIDPGKTAEGNLPDIPEKNEYEYVAAMVEPRTDNLVETIRTFIDKLPSETHFQIYHGTKNKDLLERTFSNEITNNKISLWNMGVDNLTIKGYNYLLTSEKFWNSMRSENILIFQTDTTLCSASKYNFKDFIEYDFIGAPNNEIVNNFVHFYFLGRGQVVDYRNFMNGGLSFRKKNKMIEALQKYPWDGRMPEDTWFCSALYKMNAKLPSREEARNFSFESEQLLSTPWGLHKPRREIEKLKQLCPEVKDIPVVSAHSDFRSLYLF